MFNMHKVGFERSPVCGKLIDVAILSPYDTKKLQDKQFLENLKTANFKANNKSLGKKYEEAVSFWSFMITHFQRYK